MEMTTTELEKNIVVYSGQMTKQSVSQKAERTVT